MQRATAESAELKGQASRRHGETGPTSGPCPGLVQQKVEPAAWPGVMLRLVSVGLAATVQAESPNRQIAEALILAQIANRAALLRDSARFAQPCLRVYQQI
jgi:hypothetical protein